MLTGFYRTTPCHPVTVSKLYCVWIGLTDLGNVSVSNISLVSAYSLMSRLVGLLAARVS